MSSSNGENNFNYDEPYQPRSFWEKVDDESKQHFFMLSLILAVLVAILIHGIVVLLVEGIETQMVFQLIAGEVALALCTFWILGKIFQEIERIDESN